MGVVSKTSLGDGGGSDRKLTVHSAVTELLLMPRSNHLSPLHSLPLSPADEIAKEKSLTEKDQRHQ